MKRLSAATAAIACLLSFPQRSAAAAISLPTFLGSTGSVVALAEPANGTADIKHIAFPRGKGTLTLTITIVDKDGGTVTRPVTITTIDPWQRPGRLPTDSNQDYADKLAEAKGAASVKKAEVIAAAVNKEFKKEFDALGVKAEPGKSSLTYKENVGGGLKPKPSDLYEVTAFFGALQIPRVLEEPGKDKDGKPIVKPAIAIKVEGKLGEFGDGFGFLPKPRSASLGSFGRWIDGGQTVATGLDAEGNPSQVELGLNGLVATFEPTAGMTDEDVLKQLEKLLDEIGLPVTFDSSLKTLFFDNPIRDGNELFFGNTDVGLEFTASLSPLGEVPEPASLMLFGSGLVAVVATSRRRRLGRSRRTTTDNR